MYEVESTFCHGNNLPFTVAKTCSVLLYNFKEYFAFPETINMVRPNSVVVANIIVCWTCTTSAHNYCKHRVDSGTSKTGVSD